MKAFFFFFIYFIAAALLGALISYPIYQLLHSGTFAFERWVSRFALLLLLLGLIPSLKLNKLNLNLIGYNLSFKNFLKKFTLGYTAGLFILIVVILILFILQVRVFSEDASLTFYFLLKAFLAGLIIALLEETLFRGLFFSLAKKWHGPVTAIFISSFFYAILHFIKPISHITADSLYWLSGIHVISNAFSGLLVMNIGDFLALFSVGILLALVRSRTNTLAYCVGLHASWVFLLKSTKELSHLEPLSSWSFLIGQYDGIIGLLTFVWLLVVSFIFIRYQH